MLFIARRADRSMQRTKSQSHITEKSACSYSVGEEEQYIGIICRSVAFLRRYWVDTERDSMHIVLHLNVIFLGTHLCELYVLILFSL